MGNIEPIEQRAECPACAAKLIRSKGARWHRVDGGWQPMPLQEAQRFIEAMPPTGTMDMAGWQRFREARMVCNGMHPREIRAELEKLGRRLPD